MIIASDYLTQIIKQQSYPGAIAFSALMIAIVGVVWAFVWWFKD